MKFNLFLIGSIAISTLGVAQTSENEATDSWLDKIPTPVTNPLFFEEAQIRSDIRPVFIQHNLGSSVDSDLGKIPLDGDARVYAIQLRYAVNDRLALIATKDGYIDFNPDATFPHDEGFADLAFGVKYAIIKDDAKQFILTPGLKFELPSGEGSVLQGNGDGEWNLFLSFAKGYDKISLAGHGGIRVPNDGDQETTSLHYGLQVAYDAHQYFKPFVAANAFSVVSEGAGLPLHGEGFDLVNFGSSAAKGTTQAAVGFGFRSRLMASLDLGFAYEFGATNTDDIFKDRYTIDMVFRF